MVEQTFSPCQVSIKFSLNVSWGPPGCTEGFSRATKKRRGKEKKSTHRWIVLEADCSPPDKSVIHGRFLLVFQKEKGKLTAGPHSKAITEP